MFLDRIVLFVAFRRCQGMYPSRRSISDALLRVSCPLLRACNGRGPIWLISPLRAFWTPPPMFSPVNTRPYKRTVRMIPLK